jgi:hypothetical protein
MNTKNIVCIELRTLNGKSLDRVAEANNISFESLDALKKEGVVKVWIDINTTNRSYVAFLMKGEKDITVKPAYCPISKREIKALVNMTPFVYKKVDVKVDDVVEVSNVFIEDLISDFDVVLDTDTILEKISATGMKSLTKAELDFLNSL